MTQKPMTLRQRVALVFTDQLGVRSSAITLNANLVNDLGMDSLDRIECMMAFEEEFDIEITDPEAERVVTVADVIALIEAKKSSKAA